MMYDIRPSATWNHLLIICVKVPQSRLVTSYAVSPQAKFTCPPCSLRFRSTTSSPPQRLTFCSLISPKPRLVCFCETLGANLSAESPIGTTAFDLQSSCSPVVHLETALISDHDQASNLATHLLAVHQDGNVTCYNTSLEKELWSSNLSSANDRHVLVATLTNIVHLRKGLLKHREDVLASFGAIEEESHGNALILLMSVNDPKSKRNKTKLALRIYKLNITATDSHGIARKNRQGLQELISIDVPERDHPKKQDSNFTLHVASGTLYQQTPGLMIKYDMTGLSPKIAHEVTMGEEDTASLLRLSPFTVAMSRQSSLSLIGLPYCSIQAECRVDLLPSSENSPLRLLSYFASLKVIVAIKGRRLMTIRQSDPYDKSGASRKRKREGMLIDSIGRGRHSATQSQATDGALGRSIKSLGTLLATSEDQAWESQKAALDSWYRSGGTEAFPTAITNDLEIRNPDHTTYVDHSKMSYLLSRLFTLKGDVGVSAELGLKINYLDQDAIFIWLSKKGFLTLNRIESSLKQAGSLHVSETLAPVALIDALAREDPSLRLLTSLLASQIPLSPQELVSALAAAIQQWDSTRSHDPKLIKDAEPYPDPTHIRNDDSAPPSKSLPPAIATTGTSPIQLLHLIISRLLHFSQPTIASALRTQLTKPQLLHLIDILRIEIAGSGWLSPYDDSLTPPTALSIPSNQLAHIAHLLNSTVDAIGAGGWILGSGLNDGMAETANTISYMKAEISAALEGIEEAVYLKGMLGEVLLCGKEALLPPKLKEASTLPPKNVPQIVALPDAESSSALPLGLKLEKKVSLTKVGAGGELIGRSRRDVGRLKSKMVGKYSFEHISV